MPRAVDGTRRKDRRKKITSQTKGYWGRRKNAFRTAKDALSKSLAYAYRDRKARKRDFRRLWITRISAACRAEGMSYSRFMEGLRKADIQMDRKALSNLAIEDRDAFNQLVSASRAQLDG
ncbi:50S ribosomal protein L20 [Alkalispirochaeta sphaeroplastigenens]|uniref:Large ribosomal subunit protein bL20 n=1 Tax=Alkalispirochaeta sphaeroplastigenens TaxID=1187066 RepID=A0A2S4JWS6_9SPIO|nr:MULTISPECIES: 50S ribosomal protein L20 [Alkalispirochaeta]POR03961.1 50S ribosomal protein L20 [Alkalispirochaeta sphaeroplastigenens]